MMTSPVKDANSDRKKMKAAEIDVKLTHRKTLTFDCVEDDSRIRISGSKTLIDLLKRMSLDERQNMKFVDLKQMMKDCGPSDGDDKFVWDMNFPNKGKDTSEMYDIEVVLHHKYPNMIWPKIANPEGDNFTVTIARESAQVYLNFLGYGKGGVRNFAANPRPNWWPENVPYEDPSSFDAATCQLFVKGIMKTFNVPPNFKNLVGPARYKKRRTKIVTDDD